MNPAQAFSRGRESVGRGVAAVREKVSGKPTVLMNELSPAQQQNRLAATALKTGLDQGNDPRSLLRSIREADLIPRDKGLLGRRIDDTLKQGESSSITQSGVNETQAILPEPTSPVNPSDLENTGAQGSKKEDRVGNLLDGANGRIPQKPAEPGTTSEPIARESPSDETSLLFRRYAILKSDRSKFQESGISSADFAQLQELMFRERGRKLMPGDITQLIQLREKLTNQLDVAEGLIPSKVNEAEQTVSEGSETAEASESLTPLAEAPLVAQKIQNDGQFQGDRRKLFGEERAKLQAKGIAITPELDQQIENAAYARALDLHYERLAQSELVNLPQAIIEDKIYRTLLDNAMAEARTSGQPLDANLVTKQILIQYHKQKDLDEKGVSPAIARSIQQDVEPAGLEASSVQAIVEPAAQTVEATQALEGPHEPTPTVNPAKGRESALAPETTTPNEVNVGELQKLLNELGSGKPLTEAQINLLQESFNKLFIQLREGIKQPEKALQNTSFAQMLTMFLLAFAKGMAAGVVPGVANQNQG